MFCFVVAYLTSIRTSVSEPSSHLAMSWRRAGKRDECLSLDETVDAASSRQQKWSATTPEQALWSATKRIAPAWRWLKTDLTMLARQDEYHDVLQAFANLLQVMGNRLLPKVGVEPLSALSAARSEVQELVFLLASLAGGGSHVKARHVADRAVLAQPTLPSKGFNSPGKSDGRTGSISGEVPAVPVVDLRASPFQVVKETTSESPVVQSIEKIIEVPHVQYVTVEKVVEKIVEKIVEVPTFMDTEKLVKVQKVHTADADCFVDLGVIMGTEKPVSVKKQSVDVACFVDFGVILDTAKPEHDEKVLAVDAECSADSGVIRAEMELVGPEAVHRVRLQEKVEEHESKYPGGTLPTELRCLENYMERLQRTMSSAERLSHKCPYCGKFPWT